MWLRIGKRARWKDRTAENGDHLREASEDLSPRLNEDLSSYEELSVFQVVSVAEARSVAAAFAVTQRSRPDSIDLVVIPDSAFTDAGLEPNPDPKNELPNDELPNDELPTYLRERHYTVPGLQDEAARLCVAGHALRSSDLLAERLSKKKIREIYTQELVEIPGLPDAVAEGWRAYLSAARVS